MGLTAESGCQHDGDGRPGNRSQGERGSPMSGAVGEPVLEVDIEVFAIAR